MADYNVKGLFQNNRRKEASAVTMTLASKISEADLREGTAEVLLQSGDTATIGKLPDGIVVTHACLLIAESFDTGVTATVNVDTVDVFGAVAVDAAAGTLIQPTATAPTYEFGGDDVIVTIGGANTTKGAVKIIFSYITVDGNTMSYLGEE